MGCCQTGDDDCTPTSHDGENNLKGSSLKPASHQRDKKRNLKNKKWKLICLCSSLEKACFENDQWSNKHNKKSTMLWIFSGFIFSHRKQLWRNYSWMVQYWFNTTSCQLFRNSSKYLRDLTLNKTFGSIVVIRL